MSAVRLGNRLYKIPGPRIVRIIIGGTLVIFGFLGFLPILGFWMIPLGLLVLSVDLPLVRRWRRRTEVWLFRRYPGLNGAINGKGNRRQTGRGRRGRSERKAANPQK